MAYSLDVLCVGAAIVDLPIGPVDASVFEKEASLPVDGIRLVAGGDALNEATILSRLGRRVGLASCVGSDAAGNFILEHCRANGIDVTHVAVKPGLDTSINVALVAADGERTFITNRQGSMWKYCEEDFDSEALEGVFAISFSFFNTPLMSGKVMAGIFRAAKERGMMVCADMVMPRHNESLDDIKEALSFVDYFFPNYDEASFLSGRTEPNEIADIFLGCGVKHAVIKTGRKGCFLKGSGVCCEVPGYAHSQVIDTIGAGDNFEAGFITALLEGRDFIECARFAHSVASLSVEAAGATGGVKSREQAEERYQSYLRSQLKG